MVEQEHHIYQLVFELDLPSDEPPAPVQDTVSRLVGRELTRLIDEVFSTYVKPEEYYRLDVLELDLGTLRIDRFEHDFPPALRAALQDTLSALLTYRKSSLRLVRRPAMSDLAAALRAFLLKGAFPWWVAAHHRRPARQLLAAVLARATSADTLPFYEVLDDEWGRKRTINTYSDGEIGEVLRLLRPETFPFLQTFPAVLQKQHARVPLAPVGRREFRFLQWNLILREFVAQRGSVFNQRVFTRRIMEDLAATADVEYFTLLTTLFQAVETTEKRITPGTQFARIIKYLWSAEAAGRKATADDATESLARDISSILDFFRHPSSPTGVIVVELEKHWRRWAEDSPRSFAAWLRHREKDERFVRKLLKNFSAAWTAYLFRVLHPAAAEACELLERLSAALRNSNSARPFGGEDFWSRVWSARLQVPTTTVSPEELVLALLKAPEVAAFDDFSLSEKARDLRLDGKAYYFLERLQAGMRLRRALNIAANSKTAPDDRAAPDLSVWLRDAAATSPPEPLIARILEWTAAHSSRQNAELWKKLVRDEKLLTLLATHLAERQLYVILQRVDPVFTARVMDLTATFQSVRFHFRASFRPALFPALLKVILSALPRKRGSVANQAAFYRSLIARWAAEHQYELRDVYLALNLILPAAGAFFRDAAGLRLLRDLVQREIETAPRLNTPLPSSNFVAKNISTITAMSEKHEQ